MLIDRAVLRLSGEDVRGFLQGLITNDVNGPLPVWAGMLTAQGKTLFDLLVWEDGADLLIDCEADQADALVRRLTLYRLRRAITIERDWTLAIHWSRSDTCGVADPRLPALGRRWIGLPSLPTIESWRAHRLSLGVTEGAGELGQDKTLWLEANALELNGVSFSKGCYVGQENTARMNWRQKINRRLAVIVQQDDPGETARAWYPDLGLAVVHRRVEDLPHAELVRPDWLIAAIGA